MICKIAAPAFSGLAMTKTVGHYEKSSPVSLRALTIKNCNGRGVAISLYFMRLLCYCEFPFLVIARNGVTKQSQGDA